MNQQEIDALIEKANHHQIWFTGDELVNIARFGTIDGMDPNEWLDALTMD